jgi:hypothetical protein
VKKLLLVLVLTTPGLAVAADLTTYLNGSIGFGSRDMERNSPFGALDLDYDDGIAYHVDGGMRLANGLLFTGAYTQTDYGDFTAFDGALLIDDDSTQRDVRFGMFMAPTPSGGFHYRLGGGFAQIEDTVGFSDAADRRGVFLEAGANKLLGQRVTLTGAATLLRLRGDEDREGLEARMGLAYALGAFDLTGDVRYLRLGSDDLPDEHHYEARLGVGGRLGRRRAVTLST